ncbi:MAG: ABC transporter ATP-binding protein [Aestuariibacter sp.]
MTVVASLENVTWSVAERPILRHISFSFEEGRAYGIIGPNGAGKTSLLKTMQGLITPSDGAVMIRQQPLDSMSARDIAKHVAWLPQIFSTPISLTVEHMVRMGLTPHKSWFQRDSIGDHQRLETALQDCDLLELRGRLFAQLSGGEQQRVLLARAIMQQADIFLLDELTSHLDVYFQHQLLALVKKLNKTIVMTIHDLNLAAQYLDELILINHGEIVAAGSPIEVLQADRLQQVFGLHCDVSLTGNNIPMVCFSHDNS